MNNEQNTPTSMHGDVPEAEATIPSTPESQPEVVEPSGEQPTVSTPTTVPSGDTGEPGSSVPDPQPESGDSSPGEGVGGAESDGGQSVSEQDDSKEETDTSEPFAGISTEDLKSLLEDKGDEYKEKGIEIYDESMPYPYNVLDVDKYRTIMAERDLGEDEYKEIEDVLLTVQRDALLAKGENPEVVEGVIKYTTELLKNQFELENEGAKEYREAIAKQKEEEEKAKQLSDEAIKEIKKNMTDEQITTISRKIATLPDGMVEWLQELGQEEPDHPFFNLLEKDPGNFEAIDTELKTLESKYKKPNINEVLTASQKDRVGLQSLLEEAKGKFLGLKNINPEDLSKDNVEKVFNFLVDPRNGIFLHSLSSTNSAKPLLQEYGLWQKVFKN